jgi:hypothetical protein
MIYTKETTAPAVTLNNGARGPEVKRLQEWLCFHGFQVVIDGHLPGGGFGPLTDKAVRAFQKKHGFQEDGSVAPSVWAALIRPLADACSYRPDSSNLAAAVVQVASAHLQQAPVEIGGDNRGPWVRHYNHGLDGAGMAWCQGFASSMVEQAAEALNIPSPIALYDAANVFSLWVPWVSESASKVNRRISGSSPAFAAKVTPGSFFFVRGGQHQWVHVGIVRTIDLAAGMITTIEGNANHQGSSNGYEVCSIRRAIANLDFGYL